MAHLGIDIEAAQRREIRWQALRALNAGRPLGVAESLILSILQELDLGVTAHSLRRELVFLEDLDLLRIGKRDVPTWVAQITAKGVQVVEYEAPAPLGIARPNRY